MDIFVVLKQMIELFLIMGLGYFLMKKHILNDEANKVMNELVVSVTTPALIFSSIFGDNNASKDIVFYVFIASFIMYIVLIVIGYITSYILVSDKNQRSIYTFMTIFSNTGFMGYPVINAMLGATAVFYAAIINLMFNVFVYTIGIYLMCKGKEKATFNIKYLLTPGTILSIVSMIIYIFDISMPSLLVDTCDMVGSMTSPMAMILIGATISKMPLKEVFNDKKVYIYTFVRQIVIPLVLYPILCITMKDIFIRSIFFILIAMPVGNISVMFAMKYHNDVNIASKNVCITTLLSIITIPLCTILLSL